MRRLPPHNMKPYSSIGFCRVDNPFTRLDNFGVLDEDDEMELLMEKKNVSDAAWAHCPGSSYA